MSISIVILMFTLIFVSFAYEEEVASRASQVLHFFPPRESQETRGFVEQCRNTNLWKGYLGRVNVFAFLNPSWYYSYRQAIMLELLKRRLEKSGFRDILFFVVTPPSGLPEDDAENDIEIKTWKKISKSIMEPEYFWGAEEASLNELGKNDDKGIIFFRDTPELRIWERFRASKDEVVIIDRCGKLTYQVIVPWSILYFPYVKAAILSTYKEDPCGPCDERSSLEHNSMNYPEHIFQKLNPDEKVNKNLESHTEQVPTVVESESFTISSGELQETEANTIVSLDTNVTTNETAISDNTVTDTLPVQTKTFRTYSVFDETYQVNETTSAENITNYENVNTTFTSDETEATIEASLQQKQTEFSPALSELETIEDYKDAQNCTSSSDPESVNNSNLTLTISNVDTDRTSSHENHQIATDTNLKNIEAKEEISSIDRKTLEEGTEDKEMSPRKEQNLPLRIILYAPHLHQEGEQLRPYTHLILKAGSPDYHDHFHSMNNVYDQQPMTSEITALENRKLDKYINSANEEPGVHGEIYDYWRTTEEDEYNDKYENAEFVDYDNTATEDTESNTDTTLGIESTVVRPSDIDSTDSDTKIDEDSNDFAQRKLIEHYNKLVPWIYYIL